MTVQKVHYNLSPSVLVRETELAHNRETLHKDTHSTDFTGNWFFLQRKNKRSSSTTSSPSKIHFCVFFIFTINYFWSWGSIKKFITNKDKFIAEKILGVGREKSLWSRLYHRLDNCTWTWIKIRSNVFTNFNCREGR